MIVRAATADDAEAILEMGARMHEEGAYAFLPFERDKVRALIAEYLGNPQECCLLVADEDGVLVGMVAGFLSDYFFCNETIASDNLLYVDREHRGRPAAARLLRSFRKWAVARGARELCLGISTSVETERTGEFYRRMGLTRIGAIYKQRLR